MRVFLDTNVLASGFATRGLCADVVREIMAEHELVISDFVLEELSRVLKQKFHLSETMIENVGLLLRRFPVIPTPKNFKSLHVRDKNDIPILASALASFADILVTGDRDLLILRKHKDLLIMSPRGFWELLHTQKNV